MRIEQNPEVLMAKLSRLEKLREQRGLKGQELEALAECAFRLALIETTTVEDSIKLLQHCLRLDGSNPKFAYHLGRVMFVHGQLDLAKQWAAFACQLCPTSHRIWSHICLLQWELNSRYQGDDQYEPNALRKRGDTITDLVREGRDDVDPKLMHFMPPESLAAKEKRQRLDEKHKRRKDSLETDKANGQPGQTAESGPTAVGLTSRFLNPGTCRWSGIKDLVFEKMLETKRSQRNVTRLAPLLQEVHESILTRRGGMAGFAILAISWLISGYPLATVRRLMKSFSESDYDKYQSLALLRRVCAIYEADESEMPQMIARHLSAGELPPLLAAVIHRRLVLWRPLDFDGFTAFRAARHYLATNDNGERDANAKNESALKESELIKELQQYLKRLHPEPPAALKDVSREPEADTHVTLASAIQMFATLEQAAQVLNKVRDDFLVYLKTGMSADLRQEMDSATYSQLAADRNGAGGVIDALRDKGSEAGDSLEELLESISSMDTSQMPPDFRSRREVCDKHFKSVQNLGNLVRLLRRADKQLDRLKDQFQTTPCSPNADVLKMLGAIGTALESGTQNTGSVEHKLSALDSTATSLNGELDQLWLKVKKLAAVHKKQALAEADIREVSKVRQQFEDVLKQCDETLQDVAALRVSDRLESSDELQQLDALEKTLLALAGRRGSFLRKLNSLPPPAVEQQVVESTEGQPDTANGSSDRISTADGIAETLRLTRGGIERCFANAMASFVHYSQSTQQLPPIQAVIGATRAQHAEVLFRLGERSAARRVWSEMLRDDALDVDIWKNLAVCDNGSPNISRGLGSWRRYIELLYFFDIVEDDPRPHNEQRVEFHRAIGESFAPGILIEELTSEWGKNVDTEASVAFFGNSARVRNFVDQKLLEFSNCQVEYHSHVLVLGVTREDGEHILDVAAGTMIDFQSESSACLPDRIRPPFSRLVGQEIETARTAASKISTFSHEKDPQYDEEKQRHFGLLTRFAELKYKIFQTIDRDDQLAARITSVDFLEELMRLDKIPLNQTPRFAEPVAGSLGLNAEQLSGFMAYLGEIFVSKLMSFLLKPKVDPIDAQRQVQQYRRLAEQWVHRPALKEHLSLIDLHAGHFYERQTREMIAEAAESGDISVELMLELSTLHKRLPGLSGIALDLAKLYELQEKEDDAIAVLSNSVNAAFSDDGKDSCRRTIAHLKMNRCVADEDYAAATIPALELLAMDDQSIETVRHVVNLFVSAAGQRAGDPGYERMGNAIDAWLERAREKIKKWEPTEDQIRCPVTERDLETALERKRKGVIEGHQRSMIAHFNRGAAASRDDHRRAEMKGHMNSAKADAHFIIQNADEVKDQVEIDEAKGILEELSQI